jgi:hypothetical protein
MRISYTRILMPAFLNACILNACILNACILNACILNACILNACILNACIFLMIERIITLTRKGAKASLAQYPFERVQHFVAPFTL